MKGKGRVFLCLRQEMAVDEEEKITRTGRRGIFISQSSVAKILAVMNDKEVEGKNSV